MNILFSPIGTTDPISEYNFRDAAMLHICRYRDIDKVYMYMSGEICGYHQQDNRYLYCLEKLCEHLGRDIAYEIIERRELIDDVNSFDFFIDEFRTIVNEIHEKNPEDTIFLNVSSGTPGMKSALQGLEPFVSYKVTPLQVRTPDRKSNGHSADKKKYDLAELWDLNEDNSIVDDRTSVSDNSAFFTQIKKNNIAELIRSYDYAGAAALANSMKDRLSEDFIGLINAADSRSKLNFRLAKKVFADHGHRLLEVETTGLTEIAEYLLILDLKVRKHEYVDFLRGITPLIADLFEMILKNSCGFDVDEYTITKKGIAKWDIDKLIRNQQVMEELNRRFGGSFKPGPVYSSATSIIIEALSDNGDLVELCKRLRDTEDDLRNIAAHEIVGISEKDIRSKLNCAPSDIVDMLFTAMNYAGIRKGMEFFRSYDRMNEFLIENI